MHIDKWDHMIQISRHGATDRLRCNGKPRLTQRPPRPPHGTEGKDTEMTRFAFAALASALTLAGAAAHAETVGIGDDTVNLFAPHASETTVDSTRDASGLTGPEIRSPFGTTAGSLDARQRELDARLEAQGPTYR